MRKPMAWALAACLLLAGCGRQAGPAESGEENIAAVPLEGDAVSPDGRLNVRLAGENTGITAGGLYPAEHVQIVDTDTGEVLWEDLGYYRTAALWSPGGRYVVLARTARTYVAVTAVETESWTSWDVTLPDGGTIPEYAFLPEDEPWGEWLDGDTLRLTLGRGGDGGEQSTYQCRLQCEFGQLTGQTFEAAAEPLAGEWDFDHDGAPETAAVVTVWDPEGPELAAWYELCVRQQDGSLLWRQEAATAHAGWNSLFACTQDGQDYILRYQPSMHQGWCDYAYEMFSLGEGGEEVVLQKNSVDFDINFGAEDHRYDPPAIADFLWEVRGLLADSTLLLSTEGGIMQSAMLGFDWYFDLFGGDSREALEAAVRQKEAEWKAEQGVS